MSDHTRVHPSNITCEICGSNAVVCFKGWEQERETLTLQLALAREGLEKIIEMGDHGDWFVVAKITLEKLSETNS